jgi:ABC-2 type transport system ATP-binding protein
MEQQSDTTGRNGWAIRAEQLHRHFGDVHALRGLNLEVATGTTVGFIGNNGAGKTTTLHTLLGLIPRDQGRVEVLGCDPAHDPLYVRAHVGFFAERDAPYDWMRLQTLYDLGAATYPGWDRSLCGDFCRRFGLDSRKRIRESSKGMVAKAKLIFAMAHRPRCLILDEPSAGLDPGSRQELLDMISETARSEGTTTLFSSHQLEDIEGIATHVVLIHHGRTLLSAPIEIVREQFGLLEIRRGLAAVPPAPASEVLHAVDGAAATWWLVRDRSAESVQAALSAIDPEQRTLHETTVRTVFLFLTANRVDVPNRTGRPTDASGRHC